MRERTGAIGIHRQRKKQEDMQRQVTGLNGAKVKRTTAGMELHAPERRCSSRTFRYGYLVTT